MRTADETWKAVNSKVRDVERQMARESYEAYRALCWAGGYCDEWRKRNAKADRLRAARLRLIRASGKWLSRALDELSGQPWRE